MKTFSTIPGRESVRTVACAYCGSRDHTELYKTEQYRFVTCHKCGLVFQNPQPIADDLLNRYSFEYFSYERENEHTFFQLMLRGLEDIGFYQYEPELIGRGRFLDIGCATGKLLECVKERGWREQGVEVCEPAVRYGIEKRGLRIRTGSLEQNRFETDFFSVVHCSHLIEHLPDPAGFFTEINRILIPGGLLIVATPNIDGFQSKLFKEKWRSAIADHVFLYSKKTLRNFLRKYHFSIESLKTWGGLEKGAGPPWIKQLLDRAAKRFGFGDVMIAAALNPATKRE
jgi:2-polyprenyl-3-methyl-5-hydroxy-6-metoxy-1,4-benzoquinol methylase